MPESPTDMRELCSTKMPRYPEYIIHPQATFPGCAMPCGIGRGIAGDIACDMLPARLGVARVKMASAASYGGGLALLALACQRLLLHL